MRVFTGLRFDNLRGDLFGGITAAVIALPLALAFGVASGAGPMAGLYGAIFVGFFAALFGGTATQVSGPTGPMTVVMATVITQYAHEPAMAFAVVIMGGALQILFGVLRLGKLVSLVPITVVSGFMSGIGCIIIILQFAPLLGHGNPAGGTVAALLGWTDAVTHINWDAAIVGAVTLVLVCLMPPRFARLVPPALLALLVGSFLVLFALPDAPVLGDIPTGVPTPKLPVLELAAIPDMLGSALVLALLGSIDTLLTSLVADSMTRTEHESNRELIGQGIGNMVAGLFGGIPGAGATMRTVVNIRAGGKTGMSGIIHALVLLALILGLAPLAERIPHAVLAGILIKVGIDIIDWRFLTRIKYAPRPGVAIMFLVFGLTVFVDLILAVSVGLISASLLFVKRMADLQVANARTAHTALDEVTLDEEIRRILHESADALVVFRFSGPISFGGAKEMMRGLSVRVETKVIILDLSGVTLIDTTGAFAVEGLLSRAVSSGQEVLIVGLPAQSRKMLSGLRILDSVDSDHFFADRHNAIRYAAKLITGKKAVSAPAESQTG